MGTFTINTGCRAFLSLRQQVLVDAAIQRDLADLCYARAEPPPEQAPIQVEAPPESAYLARKPDESRQVHRARVRAYNKLKG